jgi:glutamate carboxypeptidase
MVHLISGCQDPVMPLKPMPATAQNSCRTRVAHRRRVGCWLALLAALSVAAMSNAAGLDPQEVAIAAWVDANSGAAETLLEELVNVNSGTMNHPGVRAVGARLAREFDALGFSTEWIEMPPEVGRAGHLFARHVGGRGRKILLIGHLDTVFEPEDRFQSFSRDGSTARGPGVSDMKAGNVVILFALKALAAAGMLEGVQLVAAFTGDEESPGEPLSVSRRDLVEAGKWADVALGFEAGIVDEQAEWATVARRSSSEWRLEVSGKQAHSAGIFGEDTGAGAIFEAARILDGFYNEVRGEQYLTFNAGTILGGTEVDYDAEATRGTAFGKTNVVPRRAVVHGGLRTISDEQTARAREAMRAVVARHLPRTDASITFTEGYPAMTPTEGNLRLQAMLSDVNVDLGRKAMPALDPGRRGAADISFVAPYTDGLAGMGAYGEGAHTPGEELDLASLPVATKRAAILIHRLAREGSAPD